MEALTSQIPFSIIVPTYHEVNNIPLLIERIAAVDFAGRHFEVILMDDNSDDGTEQVVSELRERHPWLKLIIRTKKRDMSQAIVEGFQHAKYPILIVLDADLSHPPEKIPDMLAALEEPNTDLVIGSRYIRGGSVDSQWPLTRILSSRTSATISRWVLLIKAKDPLSGFIAIHKEKLMAGAPLLPIGWKIGLEIIIKCHCKNIREVPIHFSERVSGKSKLNSKIALAYFQHVFQLFCYKLRPLKP